MLELLDTTLHAPEIAQYELCGDDCGTELTSGDLRLLFRADGIVTLFPNDGDEANAAIAETTLAEPLAPPIFRGSFNDACRRRGQLPDEDRLSAFIVTHDEIYTPARLEATREQR